MEDQAKCQHMKFTAANIAIIISILSVIVAFVSVAISWKSYDYAVSIEKAGVSLIDVNVTIKRDAPDKLSLRLLAILKNIGKESLKIKEIKTGYYDFNKEIFDILTENHSLLNTIHSEAVFNHPFSFFVQDIDSKLSDSEVEASLTDWIGEIALILVVKYEGKLSGDGVDKYYLGYKGLSKTHQLSEKEYLEMEPKITSDFRRNF
ncbi:MAG: hypothetical protein IME96_05725 [Proteobacteria bacterium]|nr:hypothetical protein [Pseudomonadota bacterium]